LPLVPDDLLTSDDPPATADRSEASDIIDAELNRLPEKYRAPLLLCYYDGHTNTAAARALGWPAGTVSVRLARARALLRDPLARRGLALSATGLAPAVPATLNESAVRHARLALAVPSVRAADSAVFLLANQVVRTMTVLHWTKIAA